MGASEVADQILSQAGCIGRPPWVLGEDERRLLRDGIAQLETELERYRDLCQRLVDFYDKGYTASRLWSLTADAREALENKQP